VNNRTMPVLRQVISYNRRVSYGEVVVCVYLLQGMKRAVVLIAAFCEFKTLKYCDFYRHTPTDTPQFLLIFRPCYDPSIVTITLDAYLHSPQKHSLTRSADPEVCLGFNLAAGRMQSNKNFILNKVRNSTPCQVGTLLPRHGASSGCG
jgi:hypothetical protein